MDVPNTRADFVRVFELREGIEERHVGSGGFDGNHVRVQGGDGFDDVIKFAITHVRMNLCLVSDAGRGQLESADRPLEVGSPVCPAEWQALAERGFINLDYPDAGFFEIEHFVTDGERDLQSGLAARLIVSNETPLQ